MGAASGVSTQHLQAAAGALASSAAPTLSTFVDEVCNAAREVGRCEAYLQALLGEPGAATDWIARYRAANNDRMEAQRRLWRARLALYQNALLAMDGEATT